MHVDERAIHYRFLRRLLDAILRCCRCHCLFIDTLITLMISPLHATICHYAVLRMLWFDY